MLPLIRRIAAMEDVSAAQAELAAELGLDEPVSAEVFLRAQKDEKFAGYLFRSRNHPDVLAMLLNAPENAAYRQATPPHDLSNLQILKKVGQATAKWAASGFQRIDDESYERRLQACFACPHLKEAPDRVLYKVPLGRRSDPRICGACGCVASRKAGLATEACPVQDPAHPRMTRWQEPFRATA